MGRGSAWLCECRSPLFKMHLCPFVHRFPLQAQGRGAHSPEGVQHRAIGEEADEPVPHGDLVEEGLLGLHNVSVRHPQELHEAGVQSDALVAFEHQPLVCPALSEVDGGRVVLGGRERVGGGPGGGRNG